MAIPTIPPFNLPIWSVKTDGSYRMTVDYRKFNQVVTPIAAAIPDGISLFQQIKTALSSCYAAIDLANAFFCIPVNKDHQKPFTFS